MNTTDDIARRIGILHDIAARADEHTHAGDPPQQPQTRADWVTLLTASLGAVAATGRDVSRPECGELEHHLLDHAAVLLRWFEQLAREEAAA